MNYCGNYLNWLQLPNSKRYSFPETIWENMVHISEMKLPHGIMGKSLHWISSANFSYTTNITLIYLQNLKYTLIMFSTDLTFRQQENLVDIQKNVNKSSNDHVQKCQAGFRPLFRPLDNPKKYHEPKKVRSVFFENLF